MGRESSHGTKVLFNLPPLVLKARPLLVSGSAFCKSMIYIGGTGMAAPRFGIGYGR